MLYVTTRMKQDTFTAARTLAENRGPGGGFYVPLRLPKYDDKQISELGDKSFAQNAADVINLLYNVQVDGWAVEFAVGRYPVKLVNLGSREIVAETWHNPSWRFERMARGIEKAIRQSDQISPEPTDWLMISARIAVLFGIVGELIRSNIMDAESKIDIAVPNGDFSAPMAAWYAREMGLPVSNIVCCCNENGATRNLIHKGYIRTDAVAVTTSTPSCDYTVPPDLERLVFSALGQEQSFRFSETCRRGGSFYLEPSQLAALRGGLYVPVTGKNRMEAAIASLFSVNAYLADPYTALCYSGLMDYRSAAGESRKALILSEESPVHSLGLISRCIGIHPNDLKKLVNNS